MMAAILTCGPMLTSCVDSTEDNPSGGSSDPRNINEPSAFADLMYPNVYAGDDFYEYAVGRWLDQNPLKPGQYNNGTAAAMDEIRDEFLGALTSKDYGVKTATDEVITALYNDYSATEYADDKALLKEKLDKLDKATTKEALYEQMGLLVKEGYQMPFEYLCKPIERRVTPVLLFPRSTKEFIATAETLIELADMTEAEAESTMAMADDWMNFLVNQKISRKASSHRNDYREARLEKVNLRSGTRGAATALQAILKAAGIDADKDLMADTHFAYVEDYIDACPLDQLKRLCKYLVVDRDCDYIPSDPNNKQRVWKAEDIVASLCKCSYSPIAVNVSAVFNKAISAANREAVMKMAKELRASFKERINNRQWISAATKANAIEKLEAMTFYVGWPGDDSGRKNWLMKAPNKKSIYQDILDLFKQRTALVYQMKGKEGEANIFYVHEWGSPSYENNAAYMQSDNSMYILSNNLISPSFDIQMIDAMKYGMLGTLVGHEITHGFDNEGCLYNKIGK
jgi:putative endopeptidase